MPLSATKEKGASNGDVIPPGTTSAAIAANGALSVQLTPNSGATPIGTYYTVTLHLDDGTVSRQYWVVPLSATPVKVSAIESTVLPISVAMQTVSKSYVDTAIETAVTGHPLDSNPFTLKAGDAMTGPLLLPADPVSANQAADKNYVDQAIAASAGSGTQKISLGGDLGGTATAPRVTGIQGSPVSATAPAPGQSLTWNGTTYVPTTDDDLSSPPAIGNVTGAPSLSVAALNAPNSAWDSYSPINLSCTQTTFPGDNGSGYPAGFCVNMTFNDWNPGGDYGSPGALSNFGWYLPYAFQLTTDSRSAGIREAMSLNSTYTGPGDTVELSLTANTKEVVTSGSTEGFHMVREQLTELGDYGGTVATGGAGATALNLNYGYSEIGINSPFIDLNTRTACTLTGLGRVTLGNGFLTTATTSCSIPASLGGTFAANVDVPRLAPNTTGEISHSTQTVTLNTTADLTTLPSPIVCSIYGGAFYDQIGAFQGTPITFGTYNSTAHTQTVTANFFYSHVAGENFQCGGAVGMYFDQTAVEPGQGGDNIYLLRIYGSPAANTVLIGSETQGFSGNQFVSGAGDIYKGGDVVGVVNPANSKPDGQYVAIMPNTAPWVSGGDSVENTNNVAASYYNDYRNTVVNNPYANRNVHLDHWYGYGGGLSESSGWLEFRNYNDDANYVGMGGKFIAPYWVVLKGPVSAGLISQYAPLPDPYGVDTTGCPAGFLLGICGLAPGATSTQEGILGLDSGSYIAYNHATGHFQIVTYNGSGGGFDYNGSPVCTQATGCAFTVPMTLNEVNNSSPVLNLISYGNGDNQIRGGITFAESNYGDTSSTRYASLQLYGEPGYYGGDPGLALAMHKWDGTNIPLLYGAGQGGSTPFTLSLENGYIPCAKLICLGPAATMDANGNAVVNSIAPVAGYSGPAAAPSGPCPTNGMWVFSQDGHATFCAAGVWTTKL